MKPVRSILAILAVGGLLAVGLVPALPQLLQASYSPISPLGLAGCLLALAGGVGGAGVVADPHARAGEVGQHAIDAVERGARHQADVQIGCAHCSCAQCESVGLKAPLSAALCALQLARRRPAAAAQGPPRRVCGALLASAGGVPLRGEGAQRLRGGFMSSSRRPTPCRDAHGLPRRQRWWWPRSLVWTAACAGSPAPPENQ